MGPQRRNMMLQEAIKKYFDFRIAVIEMEFGESKKDAWSRHISEHPEDEYANIKIFNRENHFSHPFEKEKGNESLAP